MEVEHEEEEEEEKKGQEEEERLSCGAAGRLARERHSVLSNRRPEIITPGWWRIESSSLRNRRSRGAGKTHVYLSAPSLLTPPAATDCQWDQSASPRQDHQQLIEPLSGKGGGGEVVEREQGGGEKVVGRGGGGLRGGGRKEVVG